MDWIDQVKEYCTKKSIPISEFAKIININPSTFYSYLRGRRKLPDYRRAVILHVTELRDEKTFEVTRGDSLVEAIKNLEYQVFNLKKIVDLKDEISEKDNLSKRAKMVKRAFYDLADTIEYFKTCPEKDREELKKALDPRDIGHLTSVLNAITNPELFGTWSIFSSYRWRGRD